MIAGIDYDDQPGGTCCVYKMPYERTGPWMCPTCGLIHGWPIEPQEIEAGHVMDVCLANELAEVRSFRPLRKRQFWAHAIEEAIIERYSTYAERTKAMQVAA